TRAVESAVFEATILEDDALQLEIAHETEGIRLEAFRPIGRLEHDAFEPAAFQHQTVDAHAAELRIGDDRVLEQPIPTEYAVRRQPLHEAVGFHDDRLDLRAVEAAVLERARRDAEVAHLRTVESATDQPTFVHGQVDETGAVELVVAHFALLDQRAF